MLTNEQLEQRRKGIGGSDAGGVMGINFCTGFLSPDCSRSLDIPYTLIVDHIDHIVNLVGPDHVGFGSDFDGAGVPNEIKDVTGFNLLVKELEKREYSDEDINKICHGNFIRVFEKVWK